MAHDGLPSALENRHHEQAPTGQLWPPHRVNAASNSVEPTASDAVPDRFRVEADSNQLRPAHDAVLFGGQL